MKKAVEEVIENGMFCKKAAEKYGLCAKTVRTYVNKARSATKTELVKVSDIFGKDSQSSKSSLKPEQEKNENVGKQITHQGPLENVVDLPVSSQKNSNKENFEKQFKSSEMHVLSRNFENTGKPISCTETVLNNVNYELEPLIPSSQNVQDESYECMIDEP